MRTSTLRWPALAAWIAVSLAPHAGGAAPMPSPAPAATPPAAPADTHAATSKEEAAEPAITAGGPEGDFLRAMHTFIHFRWATKFVDWSASKQPPKAAINNPSLAAEVVFSVLWDGSPAQVTIKQSSGVAAFDAAAIASIVGEGKAKFPLPPVDTLGDDGVAHIRWIFARDHRMCGLGEVRRFEAPLKDALPRLFVQGRMKEALLRVARYTRQGDPSAMSEFARAYLLRPSSDPTVDVRAAAGLARIGDTRAIARLKPALARPPTMPVAAPALAALQVDVCGLVNPALKGTGEPALQAARTLVATGTELAADSPCITDLTTAVKNPMAPAAVRAEMLDTLTAVNPGGVRKLALEAMGDSDARMRAAGVRAFARPKGGRPTLYRLQPLVNDPSSEVRAAVAAGMLRACGDLANDYVQPLLKARDAQPLVAMTVELGKASSPASADLLAKLQKRSDPELRMPMLTALSARHDPAGVALYQPLADRVKKDPFATAEARRIVYTTADLSELAPFGKDPVLGVMAYRALLRAKRHSEAVDWLVAAFDRLPPEMLVEALGLWLAESATGPKP